MKIDAKLARAIFCTVTISLSGFAIFSAVPVESAEPWVEVQYQEGRPFEVQASCSFAPPACSATVKNTTTKKVAAVAMRLTQIGRGNTSLGATTLTINTVFPLPFVRGGFAPGEEIVFDDFQFQPASELSGVRFSVLFAEFTDGSVWGNASAIELAQVRAERDGADSVIEFLRETKAQKGAEAALRELGIP
jgi:hypothetical protein